jgi:hypothetical protein
LVLSLYLSELTLNIGVLTSLSNLCNVLATLERDVSTFDRDSCNFLAKSLGNGDIFGFGLILLLGVFVVATTVVVSDNVGAVVDRFME